MKKILKKFKLNNRGNTLAIVLIGIIIIGILGSVMLKATGVNVGMKISDLKSKQNFYYAEKAIDDIYAGIGKNVTDAIDKSYNEVLGTLVSKSGSTYSNKEGSVAKTEFENKYFTRLNSIYPPTGTTEANIDNVLALLLGYVGDYSAFGVDVSVEKTAGSDYSVPILDAGTTQVVYDTDSTTGKIEKVTIKNVVVRSESKTGHYQASITTDFVITNPDIDFNFSDTSSQDYDEFFRYAIVADGNLAKKPLNADWNTEPGSVYIDGGANATINGNIYAGSFKGEDKECLGSRYIEKEGIYVGADSKLNLYGADVVTTGAVKLANSAQISLYKEDKTHNPYIPEDELKSSLRLWAKDILLSGNDALANICGDCFIKDDLEVNGNNGRVNVAGSYYGIGIDTDDPDTNPDALNRDTGIYTEKYSNVTENFQISTSGTGATAEHEKRSAVIVNGSLADVQLTTGKDIDGTDVAPYASSTDEKDFILGGRAYIDISTNAGAGVQNDSADYMTGESIAVKDNQQIYLLSDPSQYQTGNKTLKLNPMSETDILNIWNSDSTIPWSMGQPYSTDDFYNFNSLLINNVAAKKVNGNIYFYNRQKAPVLQTRYVEETFEQSVINGSYDKLSEVVNEMGIKNLSLGDNTRSYTVGTAMQVKGGTLNFNKGDAPDSLGVGMDSKEFVNVLCDAADRYDMMTYNFLSNVKNDRTQKIGEGTIANTANGDSPYDYYIDHEGYLDGKVGTGRNLLVIDMYNDSVWDASKGCKVWKKNSTYLGEAVDSISQKELQDAGLTGNDKLLVMVMDNLNIDKNTPAMQEGCTAGVIICSGNVTVNCDFTGMIIAGGNISISDDYTFTANPKLMKLLRNKVHYLGDCLMQTKAAPTIKFEKGTTMLELNDGDFAFDKFVKFENWKKNAD